MDDRLRRLVHELRCAVAQALGGSTDVGRALRDIRQEGWSLYLVVDRRRDGQPLESYELPARVPSAEEVVFRIDGRDVSFLRSIGIDPTRRIKSRRA